MIDYNNVTYLIVFNIIINNNKFSLAIVSQINTLNESPRVSLSIEPVNEVNVVTGTRSGSRYQQG